MITKKLRSRRGMTLVETLTALAVFSILSVALVIGTNAAWKVYQKAVVASEARTLQSTLAQALSNELRYAEHIQTREDGTVVFDSETFGQKVAVSADDGRVWVGTETARYELLPEKAYTNGLRAAAQIAYADGSFTVKLTIRHPLLPSGGRENTIIIQALNAEKDPDPSTP